MRETFFYGTSKSSFIFKIVVVENVIWQEYLHTTHALSSKQASSIIPDIPLRYLHYTQVS
jgi:hypothetical protein